MSHRSTRPEARAVPDLRVTPAVAVTVLTSLVTALGSTPGARATDTAAYPQGAAAYHANCAVCHGPAGAGVPALAPPLLAEPARFAASPAGRRQLAITLLYGMFGDIEVGQSHFNSQMPDFSRLDDATLAATLNFVMFDLARAATTIRPLAPEEIAAERAHPLDGAAVRAHRKSLVAGGS